jgi:DNA-binding transcriptional LysR family regulator
MGVSLGSSMFDWNDLRYLLAVAKHGSTIAAARHLNVNQSTVQRRLGELENNLGLRLVERSPSGYRLTTAGAAVLPHAEQVAVAIEAFRQKVIEAAHAGILRLTCPEPIAVRLTQSGFIGRFHARHPDIRVQFVLADRYIDLSKGEADVALRSGDTAGDLVGRKIAESIWAAYASRSYLERNGAPTSVEDLKHHPLIALDESLARHRLSAWLREVAPDAQFMARSNSMLGLVSAAKAGVGVAALPIALGDAEPDLVRCLEPIPELARAWRVLTHPDMRRLPRVKAFFDFVVSEIEALKPILTG